MAVKFNFDFAGYSDFTDFVDEHEETINKMGGDGADKLADQIKRQVEWNEQLPEHFTFTDTQYVQMVKADRQGMKALKEDRRVNVEEIESDE